MADFKIYADAYAMFAQNNFTGAQNCLFVGHDDAYSKGAQGGLQGSMGLVGGLIAGKMASKDALSSLVYDALLVNQTEKGIGFIPLKAKGVNLNGNLEKMTALPDNFFWITFDSIEKITVKDSNFLSRKMKTVRIDLKNKQKIQFLSRVTEKSVPYQEENFARFMTFAARYQ